MMISPVTLAGRGLLLTLSLGLVTAAACDAEPDPNEPFAELAEAALELEDDSDAAAAPAPAPAPVPGVALPAPQPRCVLDSDGDGILSLTDYESAVPMTFDTCVANGGAVLGDIGGVLAPSLGSGSSSPSALGIDAPPVAAGGNVSVPAGANIPQVVLDWVAGTGIPDREYKPDEYDCDDFADDLEKAFEDLVPGSGTFTYIACDFDEEVGNYTSAHAITDVHGGGAVAWIEPQTGQPVDLDKDGDGQVTFGLDLSGYPTPTDGDCFIAVFDSAAAAVDAGLVLD